MKKEFISVILLAGGIGKRMQSEIPKQYLKLKGIPIAKYSFDIFMTMQEIDEIIVVCDKKYRDRFYNTTKSIKFTSPGKLRQDSVWNALQNTHEDSSVLCIHDSARPLITKEMIISVLKDGITHGAATLAMPIKFTVKNSLENQFVDKTLVRSNLWEIQTPQVIKKDLIKEGFEKAQANNLKVTDDVSLVEILGKPVKLTKSSYSNLKITTSEDLSMAQILMQNEKTML